MWLRAEVDEDKEYRVVLCRKANGERCFKLLAIGESPPSESVFVTEAVPIPLLLRRDFLGISEAVKLTNGQPFGVDAHGIWLTKEECDAWGTARGSSGIPWLDGLPPHLPPK